MRAPASLSTSATRWWCSRVRKCSGFLGCLPSSSLSRSFTVSNSVAARSTIPGITNHSDEPRSNAKPSSPHSSM